uniref:phosphoinositide 5-phosphatase n=1 Tax=Myotis myotis TaxID=51298 RepID=A0A7J7S1H3_MYOMY|nr:inositol polyphosphate-5-phosphatase J [Myotis myotis]
MEGHSSSGSRRPGTLAGLGPLPMPHGAFQTGAPSKEQTLAPASMTSAPASVGPTPAKQRDAPALRSLPPSEGHRQPPAQASSPVASPSLIQSPPDPRLSPSFRARPEAPRSSPEDPVLPRPTQMLPLDVSQGPAEAGTRSPGLLSPTFRPGASSAQTVPPPLPKPPRSPSRSPSRSPNRSPCVPPAPEMALPRPGTQGAGPGGHLSPSFQPREMPAPVTTSSSTPTSSSSSSWSAQPTCKSDPGFWITVVTWNVGTAMPPDDVTSLLRLGGGSDDSDRTDMIAIGLQEVNSMINKRLKDALFTDQWSELFMGALAPFNFVLVSTVRMQGVILLLFAKYYHLPFLRDVQTDCTRTGLGGYWGNKGGVSVRLAAFGHMLCFLNCHLPAHMDKAEQRKDNFQTILSLQLSPHLTLCPGQGWPTGVPQTQS